MSSDVFNEGIINHSGRIDALEIAPMHRDIVHLIPFKPTRIRKRGSKEEVLSNKWGKVVVYTRETLNSFDLKVFSAFSYLLLQKLKVGDLYEAGSKVFRWKDGKHERERKIDLVGVITTKYYFLKKCMHITPSATNMDAVWDSLLRFEGSTWVFYPNGSISGLTAKIIHDVQRNRDGGWTILTSKSYLKSIEKAQKTLSISNYILQNLKNDTAVILSCWLQGQKGSVYYLDTLAESIHLKRDQNVLSKIRKALQELKTIGQLKDYAIEKDTEKKKWKVIIERNEELFKLFGLNPLTGEKNKSN